MSQASSSFATEGTQYARNNSYYLLDTVPGPGDAIPGPVTISATPPSVALTVAGTTIMTGAASVSGVLNAAGGVVTNAINAATPGLSITGGSVGAGAPVLLQTYASGTLTIKGGIGGGGGAGAGNIVMTSTSGVLIEGDTLTPGVDSVRLANSGGAVLKVLNENAAAAANYGLQVLAPAFLVNGLANFPTMGTYAAPAAATSTGGGGYTFTMTGNKAFVTTVNPAAALIVTLPLNSLGATNNWVAIVGQVGATATHVTQVINTGLLLTMTGNVTDPITVSITLL